MLLERVGKAPKAALHPSEPHSSFPSSTHSTEHLCRAGLRLHTHCQVNSSTRRRRQHRDGAHVYKQSCALQRDPKTTAGVPFIPTALSALGRWREAQDLTAKEKRTAALAGSPEGFRHPFPEDTWTRPKTWKQRATGSAKGATALSHCSFMQYPSRPPRLLLKTLFTLVWIQEGARVRRGCCIPRRCPEFGHAWQHFSAATAAGSPALEMQN